MGRQQVDVIELVRDYLIWLLQTVVHWVCLLGEDVGALPTGKEFAVGTGAGAEACGPPAGLLVTGQL